jgi:alginate O-acetyltransferase complex protein AlgJ
MTARDAQSTPILAGAAVMLVAGVLLIINLLISALPHHRPMKLFPQLHGVVQAESAVPADWKNVVTGRFQAGYAHRVASQEPFYSAAVRLRNQIEYTMLGESPVSSIVFGQRGELLESSYIADYCTRNMAAFMRTAPVWAAEIRQMQDAAAAGGQMFLYLITPSKVAQYPSFLPAAAPCLSSVADRTGIVPAWVALVRADGVNVLDTTALLFAAREKYPFAMFPRGGTHWNGVASALAAQALTANLDAHLKGRPIPDFTFTYHLAPPNLNGTDADLAELLNLFDTPDDYLVPALTSDQPLAGTCQKLNIVMVGGSFLGGIAQSFSNLPCAPRIAAYWYWSAYRNIWVHDHATFTPVLPAQRDTDLRMANVIIYEENEQLLGHSQHGPMLYHWLTGRMP